MEQSNEFVTEKAQNITAARYLYDTGLLFEINRSILHPLGLALAVELDEKGDAQFSEELWDFSDDPEGIIFSAESFLEGEKKIVEFMARVGAERMEAREKSLGYLVQTVPPEEQISPPENAVVAPEPRKALAPKTSKPLVDVQKRNEELREKKGIETGGGNVEQRFLGRMGSKAGSTDVINQERKAPEKNPDGSCAHVNTTKEPLTGGGYLVFCVDCGVPLKDPDLD